MIGNALALYFLQVEFKVKIQICLSPASTFVESVLVTINLHRKYANEFEFQSSTYLHTEGVQDLVGLLSSIIDMLIV